MPLDEFSLTYFQGDYSMIDSLSCEYSESSILFQNDDWELIFLDEIPELLFILSDTDDVSYEYEYSEDNIDDYVLLEWPPILEPLPQEELFEQIGSSVPRVWLLASDDQYYTFSLLLWAFLLEDTFPIVFPEVGSGTPENFDFYDVKFLYISSQDIFSLPLPVIYFIAPTYLEEFGDMPFQPPVVDDTFLNYPDLSYSLLNADLILDDIKPIITFSLSNIDDMNSFITLWDIFCIDTYDAISPITIFISVGLDAFEFNPTFTILEGRTTKKIVNDNFSDCTFSSSALYESFDIDILWLSPIIETFGDYTFSIRVLEDFAYTIYSFFERRYVYATNDYRYLECSFKFVLEENFETEYINYIPSRLYIRNWDRIIFNTWFDFDDFDCRIHKTSESCGVRNEDNFEIGVLVESLAWGLSNTEEFPAQFQQNYYLRTFDTMYDFVWGQMDVITFDFIKKGTYATDFQNLVAVDQFYNDIFNTRLIRTDLSEIPIFTTYVLHTIEYFTVSVPLNWYHINLLDDFDSIDYYVEEKALNSSDLSSIYINKKLMKDTYKDYET